MNGAMFHNKTELNLNLRNKGNNMNLRELSIFVSDTMDDRLAECGIDSNQITQIKILDRRLPPSEDVIWVLRPLEHKFDYETVIDWLQGWINGQIIVCYMNDNLDRDLSIEIMGNGKGMMAI